MSGPHSRLKQFIAIDLGRDRLAAVRLGVKGSEVQVGAHVSAALPPDIDPADDQWLGKWIGRKLADHRLGRAPWVFVVPRHVVGMKRLVLPSTDPHELPGMVQLRMAGQIPFSIESAVIDSAVFKQEDGRSELIAAALHREQLERFRRLAKAAGARLARVTLRPLATAALVGDLAAKIESALLVVDLRDRNEVEVVVEWGGALRFARAAETHFGAPRDVDVHDADSEGADSQEETPSRSEDAADRPGELTHEEHARRLATETRRSWMSYRVTEDSPDVGRVVIIGDDGPAGGVAVAVREALDRPTEVLLNRTGVSGQTEDLGPLWPLVGVAIEYAEQRDRLNFLHPKRAPDLIAQRRRQWLGGAAAVVALGGLGWTYANWNLAQLEDDIDRLDQQSKELSAEVWKLRREARRLEHMERWEQTGVNWLDHLEYLSDRLPPADQMILGNLSGSLRATKLEGKYDKSTWVWGPVPQTAVFQFGGVTTQRHVADALRLRFVDDPAYTARSIGADAPAKNEKYQHSFNLALTTTLATPVEPEPAEAIDDANADGTSDSAPDSADVNDSGVASSRRTPDTPPTREPNAEGGGAP